MNPVTRRVISFKFNTLFLIALGGAAMPALAQQQSVGDCQNISDRNARFACYDQAESVKPKIPAGATQSTIPARLPAAANLSVSVPASSAGTAAPASSSSARVTTVPAEKAKTPFYKKLWPFGHDDDSTAKDANPATTSAPAKTGNEVEDFGRKSAKVDVALDGKKELVDTVASLKLVNSRVWKITLQSGQIWLQQDQATNGKYLLVEGDKISIRPSGWGDSYRLYSDRLGGYIQVVRVDN
jgi:hypothetical protein